MSSPATISRCHMSQLHSNGLRGGSINEKNLAIIERKSTLQIKYGVASSCLQSRIEWLLMYREMDHLGRPDNQRRAVLAPVPATQPLKSSTCNHSPLVHIPRSGLVNKLPIDRLREQHVPKASKLQHNGFQMLCLCLVPPWFLRDKVAKNRVKGGCQPLGLWNNCRFGRRKGRSPLAVRMEEEGRESAPFGKGK